MGQMKLPKAQAAKAAALFGLTKAEERMLNEAPYRGSIPQMPPTDPLIYRFYELVMVYGTTWKELIQEDFGDGIMSAIDFNMTMEREPNNKGDRVKMSLSGKFLPYKYYGNEEGVLNTASRRDKHESRRPHVWAGWFVRAPSMGAFLRVEVPPCAGHGERSEAQLRKGDRPWGEAWSVTGGPMNKNRIEGAAEQGERANSREALVIKARRRSRSGSRAGTEHALTGEDLALRLNGRRCRAGARSRPGP